MKELQEADVAEFIKEGKVVIKACASDGKCGYCDKFCPTFEEATKLYPDVKFGSILVPVFKPTPSEFKRLYMKGDPEDGKRPFLGTPTTVLFEGGEMKSRINGNVSLEVLKKFIETGETPPKPEPKAPTLIELKARVYDLLVTKQNVEMELQQVNGKIAEMSGGQRAN